LHHESMSTSWLQIFLTMAGMIAVINSVLVGSFVGLLLVLFTLPLWACTSAGVGAFLVSVGLHQRYQWGQWMQLEHNLPVLFPSQPRQ
jgi:fatty-acid desaturase